MKTLNNENERYITQSCKGVFHMVNVNVNFQLDKSIHTRAKAYALEKDKTIKEVYTQWIVEGLERETGQTTLYDEK